MQYFSYVISGISLLISIALAYRLFKSDSKQESSELTTVIIKLESIQGGITEIKSDLFKTKEDQRTDHDAIIRMEENQKQLWKVINERMGVKHE